MARATAATSLFKSTTPVKGAIFGAINDLFLISLLEIIRANKKFDETKAVIMTGISSAMHDPFRQTVCKTFLSDQAVITLSVASFGGQLSRLFLYN